VNVEESEGVMELMAIKDSSKGGLKIKGGEITIMKREFDNNNPKFKDFQSFRRNVLCEGEGKVKVESVKKRDGIKNGTSLWMKNPTGYVLKGIVEERSSSFFIPSISSVDSEEDEEEKTKYKLIFIGSLLFPCLLSFTVKSESNISEGINSTKDFIFLFFHHTRE
jgi:hypothetical protein